MSDVAAAAAAAVTAQSRCYSWVEYRSMMRRWIPSAKGAQRREEERGGRREESIICYLTCIINIFRAPTEKQPAAAVADADATSPMDLFSLPLTAPHTHRSLALQVDSDESMYDVKTVEKRKKKRKKRRSLIASFQRGKEHNNNSVRYNLGACVCVCGRDERMGFFHYSFFFFWIEFQSENI